MPTPVSRSTVRSSRGLASCGLLAAAVLLGGCGGGSDRAAAPVAAAPTATATPGPQSATPSPQSVPPRAAVASASPPRSAPAATAASHLPVATVPVPCPSSRLGTSVRPDTGGGAAGSTYESVVFVNQGSTTCTLSGHPGVSYVVGADGHQVGAAAGRTGDPVAVSLAPGASAHAQLRVVNDGNYDLDTCQPSPVAGFRIYPPDQTASVFVAATGTTCADPSVVLLTVGPVEPGSAN